MLRGSRADDSRTQEATSSVTNQIERRNDEQANAGSNFRCSSTAEEQLQLLVPVAAAAAEGLQVMHAKYCVASESAFSPTDAPLSLACCSRTPEAQMIPRLLPLCRSSPLLLMHERQGKRKRERERDMTCSLGSDTATARHPEAGIIKSTSVSSLKLSVSVIDSQSASDRISSNGQRVIRSTHSRIRMHVPSLLSCCDPFI